MYPCDTGIFHCVWVTVWSVGWNETVWSAGWNETVWSAGWDETVWSAGWDETVWCAGWDETVWCAGWDETPSPSSSHLSQQPRQPPIQNEKYHCRIDTVSSPDDGHLVARNMYKS